jgi:hypothetical protein
MVGKIVLVVILVLAVLSILVTAISVRVNPTDDFDWWFGEVKRLAPSYGFTEEDIKEFDRVEWYDWYALGYNPEYAIKNSLSVI